MNTGIYIIKNIINGKYYVGSAINIKSRWITHKYNLNRNKHHSIHLQNAWNKYRPDAFFFETIQYCKKEDLISNEQYWINHFDSYKSGYNANPNAGSNLGRKFNNRKKLFGNKNPFFGRKHSEETKQKNRESHIGKSGPNKGKVFSKEHCKKISEAKKGKKIDSIYTNERNKKISLSRTGKKYKNK